MKAILAVKNGMTTIFDSNGNAHSATELSVDPCIITAIKTKPRDGYEAVQLSCGKKTVKSGKEKKEKPLYLREVKSAINDLKVGQEINVNETFKEGDFVTVTGISKGKGFAGVVKRWHFQGGPRTHGQSDRERGPGSSGSTTTPGRVFKGKRMAGKMGKSKVTVKNLLVLKIEPEKNYLYLKGAVPGNKKGLVIVKRI